MKELSLSLYHLLALILFFFVFCCLSTVTASSTLRFTEAGKFKIVQFTDAHFGESDEGDEEAMADMERIVDAEEKSETEPGLHLLVFSGDSVSGYSWHRSGYSKGWYERQWDKVVSVARRHNIPYALVLGNHCSEADLNRDEIVALDRSAKYANWSVTGGRHYALEIRGAVPTVDDPVINRILVFDSNRDNCLGVQGWGCVDEAQIDWYTQTTRSARNASKGPFPQALAFIHIPLVEVLNVWHAGKELVGELRDSGGISCSSINTGLFAAFSSLGDIKLVLHGHDHGNDFIGEYNDITLGYGRKSGWGGYTGLTPGARVILLHQRDDRKLQFDTWIRDKYGRRVEQRPPSIMRYVFDYPACSTYTVSRGFVLVLGAVCGMLFTLGVLVKKGSLPLPHFLTFRHWRKLLMRSAWWHRSSHDHPI